MAEIRRVSLGDSRMETSAESSGASLSGMGTAGPGSSRMETSAGLGGQGRKQFAAEELAVVLSHYDVGIVEAAQEFPRGSRKSPKMLIRTNQGLYLLKRRARGRDDPFKVAFAHALQLYLADHQFALPHLVGTKKDNNSMLQWNGAIYELFEYIKGASYDNSLEGTQDSGMTLALFHRLLRDYEPEYEPSHGSYHAARIVSTAMEQIPTTLEQVDPTGAAEQRERVLEVMRFLHDAYGDAASRVNRMGLPDWPMQVIHSDWHPGNMLFRGSRLVAVLDYDAARLKQRVLDIANGMLQFSILGGGDDPAQWPDYIDESRFRRFLRGYDGGPDSIVSKAELRTVPWLMIEALIAESVIPIAATGSFARMEGVGFLLMVEGKVRWLLENADHLVAMLMS